MDIIQKCTHPIRIADRSNGGYMYVPCGHCQACISSYRSMWLQRLDAEAKSSESVLFFTLTYDNNNIPSLTFDSGCNSLFSNRSNSDDIYLDDHNFELNSGLLNINIGSLPLIQNDKSIHPRIGYVCKTDVQKFIKRLRRRVDYDSKNLLSDIPTYSRSFRYFITSEYGPTTYRPHYHGLLYFNDVNVAKAVKEYYLFESWQLCDKQNVDISEVQTNASSYVSKYVRCDARIPDILKIPNKTAAFFLCSRKPAIGVNYFDYDSMVLKVQQHSTTYDKLFLFEDVPTVVSVPIFSRATSYFFPKNYRFNTYDTRTLCSFYSNSNKFLSRDLVVKIASCANFNDARSIISSLIPNFINDVNDFIDKSSLRDDKHYTLSELYHLLSYEQILYGIPQNRSCIIKYIYFAAKYRISLMHYIYYLTEFYSIRNSETLKFQYTCYNSMIDKGYSPLQLAKFFYPSFFVTLPYKYESMFVDQRVNYELTLSSLNISHDDIYKDGFLRSDFGNDSLIKSYTDTSLYESFIRSIIDKNIKFEKIRKLNHFINQKNGNYEAF